MSGNKLESLLVIPLLLLAVSSQEDQSYGAPDFSSTGNDFTGPSTGGGRVVGNSILEFDDSAESKKNDAGPQEYKTPLHGFGHEKSSGFSPGPSHNSFDGNKKDSGDGGSGSNNGERKIHRYVSVHVAPPEPRSRKPPPSPPPRPETRYQILFIKAPVSQDLQDIQLPPLPETKTLVYILTQKPSQSDLLKLTQRQKPKQHNPEVFFIKYKNPDKQQQQDKKPNPSPKSEYTRPHTGVNSPNFGGYAASGPTEDPDYNYETFNDNEFATQQTQQHRGFPQAQYSYSPSGQYGISG